MNGLSNLDETYREYLLAPTEDLIRFWRSRSQQAVAKASTSMLGHRCPSSSLCVFFVVVYSVMDLCLLL